MVKSHGRERTNLREHSMVGRLARGYLLQGTQGDEGSNFDRVLNEWFQLEEEEAQEMGVTLIGVLNRFNLDSLKIRKRVESPQYLQLIKKVLRNWSFSESKEKITFIRNLLVNAANLELVPDNVIKLFIDWVAKYSEEHLAIIQEIKNNPGVTRKEIWIRLYKDIPPEDSAEADLYKFIILELTTGHLIRQRREKDYSGRFVKQKQPLKRKKDFGEQSQQITSAFDDEKKYELTELGNQFTKYTMEDRSTVSKQSQKESYQRNQLLH